MSETRDGQRYYDTGDALVKNDPSEPNLLEKALYVIKSHEKTIKSLKVNNADLLEACKWTAKGEHHPACEARKGRQCNCYVGACRAAIAKAKK